MEFMPRVFRCSCVCVLFHPHSVGRRHTISDSDRGVHVCCLCVPEEIRTFDLFLFSVFVNRVLLFMAKGNRQIEPRRPYLAWRV